MKGGNIINNNAEDNNINIENIYTSVSAEPANSAKKKEEYAIYEEQLLRLIDNMSNSVVLMEPTESENDFIIKYLNSAVKKVESIPKDLIIGKKLSEIFPEIKEMNLLESIKNVWVTGNPVKVPLMHMRSGNTILYKDGYIERLFPGKLICIINDSEKEEKDAASMAEESFKMLAEKSQDIVFRYRMQPLKRYDYMSPSAYKISGYSRDEFYKDPFLHEKIIKPENLKLCKKELLEDELFKKPIIVNCNKKDGSDVFLELKCSPIKDNEGNLIAVSGAARDVTHRLNIEKSLKNANKELEELIYDLPGIVFKIFPDRKKESYISEKCLEITGFDKSELDSASFKWSSRIDETERETYTNIFKSAIENTEAYECEYVFKKKDGEDRNFVEYGSAFFDEDNNKKIVGFVSDITDYNKVLQRLNESLQTYRSIFENNHAPMMIIDPSDGSIIDANKVATDFYGYTYEEITTMRISEINTLPTRLVRNALKKADEKKKNYFKFKHQLSDGSIKDVEVYSGPISIEGKKLLFSIVHDKTTEYKMEKELIETISKTKELFLDTVNLTGKMVELRDPYTAGHQKRVSALAVKIAKKLGFSSERIEAIGVAGLLHDSGKVSIPSEILSRPGKLSKIEWELMKKHPEISSKILSEMKYPWNLEKIVLQHHERLDGSGYPLGLKGKEISIEARIIGVADVVEAMASHRPYRPAHSMKEVLEEIKQKSGTLYDPEVVNVCIDLFKEGFDFNKK